MGYLELVDDSFTYWELILGPLLSLPYFCLSSRIIANKNIDKGPCTFSIFFSLEMRRIRINDIICL